MKYSKGTKIVALILEQVSVVLFVSALSFVLLGLDSGYSPSNLINEKKFLESDVYENMVESEIYNLLRYVDSRTAFETDGIYDTKKIIDIKEYARYRQISGNVSSDSVGYYLGDLLAWAKEGVEYEETENGTLLNEIYLPVDNIRLSKRFGENLDIDAYNILQDYLLDTIYSITEDVITYKQNVNKYKEGNTNLHFYIADNTEKTVYSNISEYDSISEMDHALASIKGLGSYMIVKSGGVVFDSNTEINQRNIYQYIGNMSIGINDNYIIGIGVDTEFPVIDSLYEANTEYEKIQHYYAMAIVLGLASIVVGFICFIYLNFAAGRKNQDELIYLNYFDKIKTEIGAVFIVGLGVIILLAILSSYNSGIFNNELGVILYSAILTFIGNILFLIGYLSLVRRIKAGTLWKNSLLYSFGSFVKAIFSNLDSVVTIIVLYVAFLLVNGILSAFLWESGSFFFALLILLGLNGVIGVLLIKEAISRKQILTGVKKISEGDFDYKVDTAPIKGKNRELAEGINNIGNGIQNAVEASMKNERLKTDLITNVSHDIKTPLTSIINYVDLLKRENIENEKISNYISILDSKSQRLKHLTEDLVEASKISSGNITLNMEKINFIELIHQTNGEFTEKFDEKKLDIITNVPKETILIEADGRRLWRIIENLYNNIAKYAMEGTRVYIDIMTDGGNVYYSVKNISAQPMNIKAEELTERFIRGDVSRSTEGSGLGLSIAKNLTELQKGKFIIYLDGDLFKVTLVFKRIKE